MSAPPRYILVADEASISYLLVDLTERRVVHGIPRVVWAILSGLLADQRAIAAAVAAADSAPFHPTCPPSPPQRDPG